MQNGRYQAVAIGLHWGIAALILAAFTLGLTVDAFPEAFTDTVINTHVLIGLSILVLSVIRLGWRLRHPPPNLPQNTNPYMRRSSNIVHFGLYGLMLLVPLIGLPTLFYRGRGIDLGLFQIAPFIARTPTIFRPLTEIHLIAAYALVGLAVGHMLAAMYHQFVLKDGLMYRMLPGFRRQ